MDKIDMMKMFLAFAPIIDNSGEEKSLEDKVNYESRIVFSTPGMIKPDNWEELPLEERAERIKKMKEVIK
jgi:hypothetical protein